MILSFIIFIIVQKYFGHDTRKISINKEIIVFDGSL